MMMKPCYLAPSKIEGLGVHCREDVKKGELIWKFMGEFDRLIPISEMEAAPPHIRDFLERYTYPHPGHPGMVVLDADEGRFMNHSPTPNVDCAHPENGIALVDIPAGTELTCDYGSFIHGTLEFQPSRHAVQAAE